jgi:antirestriction protein ArdC
MNLHSGKPYRGVNVFLLAAMSWVNGYHSDFWLTFKQASERGGQVRKGEKSSLVVFWKQYAKEDHETGELVTVPVLKHYNVFNADQCEGITPPDRQLQDIGALQPFEPLQAAEKLIEGYTNMPVVIHRGSQAYYRPGTDEIVMPEPERFDIRENYYATLFHECVHSTGHSTRLDRGLDTDSAPFGSPCYSKEELIAEMGAAFLAATAGISPVTIEQSAAYIQGWMQRLKADKKLVIQAAGAAQRASDYILGTEFSSAASDQQVTFSDQPMEDGASTIQLNQRPIDECPNPPASGAGQLDLF